MDLKFVASKNWTLCQQLNVNEIKTFFKRAAPQKILL